MMMCVCVFIHLHIFNFTYNGKSVLQLDSLSGANYEKLVELIEKHK